LAVVKCLAKEFGANVNQAWNDVCTALYIAVELGNKEMVVCLVEELGADINQSTEPDGTTPLMAASG
jgi:ankyrin repeat protein